MTDNPPQLPSSVPTPAPRSRVRLWIVAAGAVLLVLLGGSTALGLSLRGHAEPAAVASPSLSVSPSASSSLPSDAKGRQTCILVGAAERAGKQGDPDTMGLVAATAAAADDPEIRWQAGLLALQVDMTRRAVGAPDEVAMRIHLVAAAIRMATACIKAGYPTAG